MEGFLLGLSAGAMCIAYCAPALIPFMLAEGSGAARNFFLLGGFLIGRFSGYMIFAGIAWIVSGFMIFDQNYRELIYGLIYTALAVWLLVSCCAKTNTACAARTLSAKTASMLETKRWVVPYVSGLLTGLNLCPPFLLAFADAANKGGLFQIVLYFMAFFLGTSVYFIPAPLIGMFRMHTQLRLVGRMAAVIASLYYFCAGVIYIAGSLYKFHL